jgi:hypothetical protein
MYITIESDHRKTNLRKVTELQFVPHSGMGFWYRIWLVTVEKVDYNEDVDNFILRFKDLKAKSEDRLFDETVDDFIGKGWEIIDQWKMK